MTCDICGRETQPGESICWDCVEWISRDDRPHLWSDTGTRCLRCGCRRRDDDGGRCPGPDGDDDAGAGSAPDRP